MMQSPRRMEHWRQLYGEEHVNNSITLLKRRVAKCWQPSWYEFAGVLTPSNLQGVSHSNPAESRVEELSDTRPKGADTKPQQSPRQHLVPHACATTMSTSRVSPHAKSSTAKDADGLQPPATLQSGKLESGPPAVEMASSSRPRRQARDKAVARIKELEAHDRRKRRPGPSDGILFAAQQGKALAKLIKSRRKKSVNGKDKTEVENPSGVRNEVIPPIKSTPVPQM